MANESRFVVSVHNSTGELVADLTGFCRGRRIVYRRNRPYTLEIRLDLDQMVELSRSIGVDIRDILATNVAEVRVRRLNLSGVWEHIFAGQIRYQEATIQGDERSIFISVHSWLALLQDRVITKDYTATDAGAIAWDLVDTTQNETNGDLGITQGTTQTSANRDRSYLRKNVYEAIEQLTEVINGFDVEISWDKVFNVYYPKMGTTKPDIVFTYPGNILTATVIQDGSRMANEIIAIGAGSGADALTTTAESIPAQTVYKLRQDTLILSDVKELDTLQEHADGELSGSVAFLDIPDITVLGTVNPEFGTYWLGDEVVIRFGEEMGLLGGASGYYRIEEITLDINDEDQEMVQLRLSK